MKQLDQILDIEPVNEEPKQIVMQRVEPEPNNQVQQDFDYARENLMDVINKGQDALFDMMDVARQSQHPRAYEVLSTLMNTIVSANKDLLDLQSKKKKLLEEDPTASPQQVTNNLFVGSTAELQKYLKQHKDGQ
jgi:hypothetical protein